MSLLNPAHGSASYCIASRIGPRITTNIICPSTISLRLLSHPPSHSLPCNVLPNSALLLVLSCPLPHSSQPTHGPLCNPAALYYSSPNTTNTDLPHPPPSGSPNKGAQLICPVNTACLIASHQTHQQSSCMHLPVPASLLIVPSPRGTLDHCAASHIPRPTETYAHLSSGRQTPSMMPAPGRWVPSGGVTMGRSICWCSLTAGSLNKVSRWFAL